MVACSRIVKYSFSIGIIGFFAIPFVLGWAPPGAAAPVTYSKDIAPLLQQHCVSCHRAGQLGPMSLRTYDEVRPWSKAILRQVATRTMPPFPAAGPIGRYVDDPRLTDAEIELVKRWVETGSPKGNPADLPAPRSFPDSDWRLGTPDLVVDLPRIKVRQNNRDDRLVAFSTYVFPEDTWIRAADLLPGNYKALHHANIFVLPPGEDVPEGLVTREEMGTKLLAYQLLLGWLPGLMTQALPDGQAILIPKGSRLFANAHYAPTREEIYDQTSVGLYFADGVIDPDAHKVLGVLITKFKIPPHDPNYEYRSTVVFPEKALVTHFNFHMHLRGKATRVIFHYPDGTSEIGIDVPNWDFHWQRQYYLNDPIIVPKGTEAEFVAVWDNSENNPDNPNPNLWIHWGKRTVDEMYGGRVYYSPADTGNETYIRVSHGRYAGPVEKTARAANDQ